MSSTRPESARLSRLTDLPTYRSTSFASGQWKDEDYDVLAGGKVVGCIYEVMGSRFGPPELRWLWSVKSMMRRSAEPIPSLSGRGSSPCSTGSRAMGSAAYWSKARIASRAI
jgi:hypothetical protein